MKKCTKCGIEKDESEFGKKKNSKSGITAYCKKCNNIKGREKYYKTIEYQKERKKGDYKKNREKRLITSTKWKNENPEKRKKIVKTYSRKSVINVKNWKKNNPERYENLHIIYGLKRSKKIDRELITLELIELKKLEIKLKRFIKKQKELQNDAS